MTFKERACFQLNPIEVWMEEKYTKAPTTAALVRPEVFRFQHEPISTKITICDATSRRDWSNNNTMHRNFCIACALIAGAKAFQQRLYSHQRCQLLTPPLVFSHIPRPSHRTLVCSKASFTGESTLKMATLHGIALHAATRKETKDRCQEKVYLAG